MQNRPEKQTSIEVTNLTPHFKNRTAAMNWNVSDFLKHSRFNRREAHWFYWQLNSASHPSPSQSSCSDFLNKLRSHLTSLMCRKGSSDTTCTIPAAHTATGMHNAWKSMRWGAVSCFSSRTADLCSPQPASYPKLCPSAECASAAAKCTLGRRSSSAQGRTRCL